MGAVSLEELAENAEDFGETVGLKPIERQRVRKWAAQVLWQAEGGVGLPAAPQGMLMDAYSGAEAWAVPPLHGEMTLGVGSGHMRGAASASMPSSGGACAGPPSGAGSLSGAGPLGGRGGAPAGLGTEDQVRPAAPVYTSRSVRLAMDSAGNTGLDLQWDEEWGVLVQGVDPLPGQPGLAVGDYILAIDGCSLRHRTPEDCDSAFAERLQNGAVLSVVSPSRGPEPSQAHLQGKGEGRGRGHVKLPPQRTSPWQLMRSQDPRLGKGQRGGYSASRMWTRFRGPPW